MPAPEHSDVWAGLFPNRAPEHYVLASFHRKISDLLAKSLEGQSRCLTALGKTALHSGKQFKCLTSVCTGRTIRSIATRSWHPASVGHFKSCSCLPRDTETEDTMDKQGLGSGNGLHMGHAHFWQHVFS